MSKTLSQIALRRGLPRKIANRVAIMDAQTGAFTTIDQVKEQSDAFFIERLQWLVDFVQRKPRHITAEDARYLDSFTYDFIDDPGAIPKRPSVTAIATLVEQIEAGLKALFDSKHHRTWSLSPRKRAIRVEWVGSPLLRYQAADWRDAVLCGVAQSVDSYGNRIASCAHEGCGKLFLKEERRERFCSALCSTRERQSRYRQRRSAEELQELRRKAYWKLIERERGKAAARRAKEEYERRSKEKDGHL